MLIFTDHITPRLQYTVHFIFDLFLGTPARITTDILELESTTDPAISYTSQRMASEFHIHSTGLLKEHGIREMNVQCKKLDGITVIFSHDFDCDLGFDIFSAVFFMISRYEEYLPGETDRYGRFPAERSIAFRNGFLEKAVVDHWIILLAHKLKKKYNRFLHASRSFRFIPTMDVDNGYIFANKGLTRSLGGLLKALISLKFKEFVLRVKVLNGKATDPFDTFEMAGKLHKEYSSAMISFILTAGYGKYDTGISPDHPAFHGMVNRIKSFSEIGLHPSWKSNRDKSLIAKEQTKLESVAGGKVARSRQHFLKVDLPGTYRILLDIGITGDYSMGFSSHPGFRAGTCSPFPFYDLENEKETTLMINPFQVMDRTLKDYLMLSLSGAVERIGEMISEIRLVNGTFISIWHNEALSDYGEWEGWSDVYRKLLELAGG